MMYPQSTHGLISQGKLEPPAGVGITHVRFQCSYQIEYHILVMGRISASAEHLHLFYICFCNWSSCSHLNPHMEDVGIMQLCNTKVTKTHLFDIKHNLVTENDSLAC